ncbi:MAG: DUF2061 domain-containing protein [Proteobacteria bacterium]|nr:DUF2061 domain-containing protein [Pseudomonadota bacterium]
MLLAILAGRSSAAADAPMSVWTYSLYKTITYELVANAADIPLYTFVLGGTPAGAGLFTAVNVTTAAAAYYAHEVVWNLYGPSMQESPTIAMEVGVEKVLVYRLVSTARNLALVYVFTGSVSATIGFAALSNVVDAAIYAANEYGWYLYGPSIATSAAESIPVALRPVSPPAPRSLSLAAITDAAAAIGRRAVDAKAAAAAAFAGTFGSRGVEIQPGR